MTGRMEFEWSFWARPGGSAKRVDHEEPFLILVLGDLSGRASTGRTESGASLAGRRACPRRSFREPYRSRVRGFGGFPPRIPVPPSCTLPGSAAVTTTPPRPGDRGDGGGGSSGQRRIGAPPSAGEGSGVSWFLGPAGLADPSNEECCIRRAQHGGYNRLNESAAAGRDDRAKLWGLEGAIPQRIGATTGPGNRRADGEGGDPVWHARRDGLIVGREAGLRHAGGDRPRRHGGAGGSGADDHARGTNPSQRWRFHSATASLTRLDRLHATYAKRLNGMRRTS